MTKVEDQLFALDEESQKEIDDLQFCQAKKWEAKNRKIHELKKEANTLAYGHQEQLKENKRLQQEIAKLGEELEMMEDLYDLLDEAQEKTLKQLTRWQNAAQFWFVGYVITFGVFLIWNSL